MTHEEKGGKKIGKLNSIAQDRDRCRMLDPEGSSSINKVLGHARAHTHTHRG